MMSLIGITNHINIIELLVNSCCLQETHAYPVAYLATVGPVPHQLSFILV